MYISYIMYISHIIWWKKERKKKDHIFSYTTRFVLQNVDIVNKNKYASFKILNKTREKERRENDKKDRKNKDKMKKKKECKHFYEDNLLSKKTSTCFFRFQGIYVLPPFYYQVKKKYIEMFLYLRNY